MAVIDEAVALGDLDAVGQAAALRRGEIGAAELTELAIERIERADPVLRVLVTSLFDDARRRVRAGLPQGPFAGVPLLVKDFLCATEGDPYFAGSSALRDRCWRAKRSSHLAARLRQAGFVILGRTNTPEFALQLTTEPLAFGPTRNPWKLSHSPGGSSGGSAAAVAAGLVAVAHGNDGAGSIRVPASACGLVGLKPSRGRTSLGPDIGESLGLLAVEGALTRSVRDTAALLDVMAGPMPGDPCVAPPPRRPYAAEVTAHAGKLRIGLVPAAPDGIATHPDCVAAATIAAIVLADLGHDVVSAAAEPYLSTHAIEADLAIRNAANVAAALDGWSARTGRPIVEGEVEPTTWELGQRGRFQSAARLAGALGALQAHGRALSTWLEGHYDLLLSPTMAEPPPCLGELCREEDPMWPIERAKPFVAFTLPFNISGQPAISLPLHWNADGLPVGVQLAAAYGREDLLLRVASQLERARPWAHRRPNPIEE
jgi:amidase